jgi:hypothetical protein
MLGAGFVTRPTLDILSDAGIQVTVGEIPLPADCPSVSSVITDM